MKHLRDNIGTIGVLVAIFASLFGGLTWVDSRYAYAEDLQQYQRQNEQTLLLIQLNQLEELTYRELLKPDPEQDKARLYKLQQQVDRLQIRYEALVKE